MDQILKAPALQVEERNVGTVVEEPGGGDWLDACCWRCGSTQPRRDPFGRMLCPPCGGELSDDRPIVPHDPLHVVRDAYWNAHVLERCWRCLTESVDPRDEVGLCRACLTTLAVHDTSQEAPSDR